MDGHLLVPSRSLGPEQSEQALATMVTAFASDPVARWVLARPTQYLALFPLVVSHVGGRAFAEGSALASEDVRAVALWLPPGVESDLEAVGGTFQSGGVMPPEDAPAFFEQMAHHHPQEPHWYLPFIGVDPGLQGQGLGARLMADALARVDASGMPAYLESSNPRNVPFYERFGFRVTGQIQVGRSPLMTPMWREAR